MAGLLDTVYRLAPVPLQHTMVTVYGWYWNRLRFGGVFQDEYAGFKQREYYTPEQWRTYQTQQLRDLLLYAYDHVPHYQKAWRDFDREQLAHLTLDDLSSLPIVTKGMVRDKPQDFVANGTPHAKHIEFTTSGSTGTPVSTFWMPNELQKSLALREARSCGFADVSYQLPRATFSGRIVEPDPESDGPYYRFNWIEKQVYFSAFHLGPQTVQKYIQALQRHQVQWITGYSNSIYQLALLAEEQGLDVPRLQAIITTSEKVTPMMRDVMERVFATKVYEEYGTVEDIMYVCENQQGELLVSPDAGIVEIVDETYKPVLAGEYGQVVATGFVRPHNPMIRFALGDVAAFSPSLSSCGRQMPVIQDVAGRIEDTVYAPDGRRMVRFHGIFVSQPHVKMAQVIQEAIDHIHLRVVPKPGFGQADIDDMTARIHQRLTDAVRVTVETVEAIEQKSSGKYQAVISKLSAEEIQALRQKTNQFN